MHAELTKIHHIAVACEDPKKQVAELGGLGLKFEIISWFDDWAFLRFANIYVALVKPGHEHLGLTLTEAQFRQALDTFRAVASVRHHRDGSVGFYQKLENGLTIEFLDRSELPEKISEIRI